MYKVAPFPYLTYFLDPFSQNKNLYTSKTLQIHMAVPFTTLNNIKSLKIQDKMLQHEF